jgi:hypothetical protein
MKDAGREDSDTRSPTGSFNFDKGSEIQKIKSGGTKFFSKIKRQR